MHLQKLPYSIPVPSTASFGNFFCLDQLLLLLRFFAFAFFFRFRLSASLAELEDVLGCMCNKPSASRVLTTHAWDILEHC